MAPQLTRNMDDKLQIIQHLYDEADAPSDRERLLEDEALRAEYEALSGIKFHLDKRPKQRPDVAVLDAVMATAAMASGQPGLRPRQDRKPQPRNAARRYGLFSTVSAVVAVLLVAGIGFFQMRQGGEMQMASETEMALEKADVFADEAKPLAEEDAGGAMDADAPSAIANAEPAGQRLARTDAVSSAPAEASNAMPPAPVARAAAGFAMAKTEAAEADMMLADDAEAKDEPLPGWGDASGEVLRVHRQLEMVETRSPEFAWDDSTVISLDVLPTNPRARDTVTPASTRRGNH